MWEGRGREERELSPDSLFGKLSFVLFLMASTLCIYNVLFFPFTVAVIPGCLICLEEVIIIYELMKNVKSIRVGTGL